MEKGCHDLKKIAKKLFNLSAAKTRQSVSREAIIKGNFYFFLTT